MNVLERAAWEKWISGDEKTEYDQEDDAIEELGDMQQDDSFSARRIYVEFAGTFDPNEFIKLMAQIHIPSGMVRIKVEVVKE